MILYDMLLHQVLAASLFYRSRFRHCISL